MGEPNELPGEVALSGLYPKLSRWTVMPSTLSMLGARNVIERIVPRCDKNQRVLRKCVGLCAGKSKAQEMAPAPASKVVSRLAGRIDRCIQPLDKIPDFLAEHTKGTAFLKFVKEHVSLPFDGKKTLN